jgi:hypothetical protein
MGKFLCKADTSERASSLIYVWISWSHFWSPKLSPCSQCLCLCAPVSSNRDAVVALVLLFSQFPTLSPEAGAWTVSPAYVKGPVLCLPTSQILTLSHHFLHPLIGLLYTPVLTAVWIPSKVTTPLGKSCYALRPCPTYMDKSYMSSISTFPEP